MPVDANIFQQYLRAPKSIMDYRADADQAEARKNALQLASMDLSEKTQANQRTVKVRNALEALGAGATDEGRINALRATATPEGYAQADSMEKMLLERKKTGAEVENKAASTKHLGAQTDAEQYKTRMAKHDQAVKDIAGFASPQEALASLQAHEAAGDVDPQKAAMIRSSIPQDPAKFPAWQLGMLKNIMAAKDQLAQVSPDANARLQAQTSRENNGATIAATDRRHKETIAGENLRAGVTADGKVDENSERTAQAIASGQLPAPTGMALLNPKNQRILGRVMEINPQYDATTVDAKKKAARDFTTGSQGNALRSFAVAGDHLAQLDKLVDAMHNGDMQLVNKLGNAFSQQTGNPAVTNFEAAKEIVGKEVVKAIVAGGGGVEERRELSQLMANAKSPAQLKGVISQFSALMGAQHEALLQQRRAAGLPDSTIPNYTGGKHGAAAAPAAPAASTAAPAGWTYIGTTK